jgi:hypothetical protein
MGRLIFRIGLVLGLLILSASVAEFADRTTAQGEVTLRGWQYRGAPGRNAKLESEPVTIRRGAVIESVEGGRAGFWIEGTRRFSFDTPAAARGASLPAGTYQVYPNLPRGAESASVTVVLRLDSEE